MGLFVKRLAGAAALTLMCQQAVAINIQFDYSYDAKNFFNSDARKTVLRNAGNYFSLLLQDDLSAIDSSGGNSFNANFTNPTTGSTVTRNDFNVAADTLVVFVGGRNLSGSTLGEGGPGGYSVSGTASFVNTASSRGETGVGTTDFAPWGGSLAFDTNTNWYFDQDISTRNDISGNDFYSVALHELGHLLGIGTADSWHNKISNGLFSGSHATAVYGSNVPLSGTGHWGNGVQGHVNGVPQEAAMDPSLTVGTRKVFTDLDNAALADIGWEVAAVPVPAAVWLFGSSLLGLLSLSKRRSLS